MDTIIYGCCGFSTLLWAAWLFVIWQKRAGLSDTSIWRFFFVLLPVLAFSLLVFNDWSGFIFLRLDLIGLLGLALLNLIGWIAQLVCILLAGKSFRRFFQISSTLIFLLNFLLVLFIYLLRANPLLAVRLSSFMESWQHFDWLRVLWEGLDPANNKETASSLFDRLIVALGIYLPMTAVRLWHTNKKFKQLKEEIDRLKAGVEDLREMGKQGPVTEERTNW